MACNIEREKKSGLLVCAPSPTRDTAYAEDWPVTRSLDLDCRCMDTWAEWIDVAEDWEIVRWSALSINHLAWWWASWMLRWDPCRAYIDQWPLTDRRLSDPSLAPAKQGTCQYYAWRSSLPSARPSVVVTCPVLVRPLSPLISLESDTHCVPRYESTRNKENIVHWSKNKCQRKRERWRRHP